MAKSNQWVVPTQNGWWLRKEWSNRLTKEFGTQKQATKAGTSVARNQWVELFIQWRNGRIRERNSFGNDPYPPRG